MDFKKSFIVIVFMMAISMPSWGSITIDGGIVYCTNGCVVENDDPISWFFGVPRLVCDGPGGECISTRKPTIEEVENGDGPNEDSDKPEAP
ncbi:hypothetical protein [Kangiella spongicola]|uniref:Uncharacterized protein n=1 Tax=Kangiella spongicola TaxID=796379 RepID=A0A318DCN3_9GAMM|nr:hypothetical protein [Kangiella spongicola]PXF63909.1 hypothetical protein DL796_01845 [Kangiella spongicola]